MSELWIDDVDLADFGFVIGANPNHQATPSFTDTSVPLLGAIGPTWAGEPVQAASRHIAISGNVRQSSSALLLSAVDSLKQLAMSGAKRLRFADHPDREFRDARTTDFIAPPRNAIFANVAADLSVAFECADPLAYDVNPQGVPLSTQRASLLLGTAPSFPLLLVHGGGGTLTNPTFTYRDAEGTAQQTFSCTVALGANDYLLIDCVRIAVTLSTAGVKTDGLSLWTSGDFLAFLPSDAWPDLSQWPTLELSATAGTPFGLATYSRAWL